MIVALGGAHIGAVHARRRAVCVGAHVSADDGVRVCAVGELERRDGVDSLGHRMLDRCGECTRCAGTGCCRGCDPETEECLSGERQPSEKSEWRLPPPFRPPGREDAWPDGLAGDHRCQSHRRSNSWGRGDGPPHLADELCDRGEIVVHGVAAQDGLDGAIVDVSVLWHLGGVIVRSAQRGTPSTEIIFRNASRPRRCSALTAPVDLPTTAATCSTVRSAVIRSISTSR